MSSSANNNQSLPIMLSITVLAVICLFDTPLVMLISSITLLCYLGSLIILEGHTSQGQNCSDSAKDEKRGANKMIRPASFTVEMTGALILVEKTDTKSFLKIAFRRSEIKLTIHPVILKSLSPFHGLFLKSPETPSAMERCRPSNQKVSLIYRSSCLLRCITSLNGASTVAHVFNAFLLSCSEPSTNSPNDHGRKTERGVLGTTLANMLEERSHPGKHETQGWKAVTKRPSLGEFEMISPRNVSFVVGQFDGLDDDEEAGEWKSASPSGSDAEKMMRPEEQSYVNLDTIDISSDDGYAESVPMVTMEGFIGKGGSELHTSKDQERGGGSRARAGGGRLRIKGVKLPKVPRWMAKIGKKLVPRKAGRSQR